jgi:hypothetical protein
MGRLSWSTSVSPSCSNLVSIAARKLGRFDESVLELTRAQELDPTSLKIAVYLAKLLKQLKRKTQMPHSSMNRSVNESHVFIPSAKPT